MTCVFLFSLQLLSELFLIQRRTERDMLKHVYLSSRKIPIIPAIFKMKLEFSERIFEKYSNIEFHKKKSVLRESCCSMRTDRHEANSCYSQFC